MVLAVSKVLPEEVFFLERDCIISPQSISVELLALGSSAKVFEGLAQLFQSSTHCACSVGFSKVFFCSWLQCLWLSCKWLSMRLCYGLRLFRRCLRTRRWVWLFWRFFRPKYIMSGCFEGAQDFRSVTFFLEGASRVHAIILAGYPGVIPAIAQLVGHPTGDCAEIRWSLARFRVAGFFHLYRHCFRTSAGSAEAGACE